MPNGLLPHGAARVSILAKEGWRQGQRNVKLDKMNEDMASDTQDDEEKMSHIWPLMSILRNAACFFCSKS